MRSNRVTLPVITRALLARCIFVAHSVIAIWQMVEVSEKTSYWSLTVIALAIFLEGMLIIISCEGQEAKWFCTSVFLYLCSIVPPLWYLQLDLSIWSVNQTVKEIKEHRTTIESTLHVSRELWIQILEQTLLVMLIIGRWMLPKGDITREQLSQILLAYLAIASDIVELFDMFKEHVIKTVNHLPYMILTAWTMSLLQFPFVMTTSKARKMRVAITTSNSDEEVKRLQYMASCEVKARPKWVQIAGDTDVWAIVLALFLQDIPFVLVRLYLMIEHKLMSYTMIFFTSKNLLVIMLQMYRMVVLVHERYHKAKIEADAHRLVNHYRHMLEACRDVLHKLKDESVGQISNMKMPRGRKRGRKPAGSGGSGSSGGGTGTVTGIGTGGGTGGGRNKRNSELQDDHYGSDQGSGSNAHLIRKPYRRKRTSFQEEEEIIQIELEKVQNEEDDGDDEDGEDVVFNPLLKTTVAHLEPNIDDEGVVDESDKNPNIIFSPSVVRRKNDKSDVDDEDAGKESKTKKVSSSSNLAGQIVTSSTKQRTPTSANTQEVDEFGSNTNTASLGVDSDEIAEPDHSKLSSSAIDSQSTLNTDEHISRNT